MVSFKSVSVLLAAAAAVTGNVVVVKKQTTCNATACLQALFAAGSPVAGCFASLLISQAAFEECLTTALGSNESISSVCAGCGGNQVFNTSG